MSNNYNNALRQFCLYCKTKPANCNRDKCNRYNTFKKCIEKAKLYDQLMNNMIEVAEDSKGRKYLKINQSQKYVDIEAIIKLNE